MLYVPANLLLFLRFVFFFVMVAIDVDVYGAFKV